MKDSIAIISIILASVIGFIICLVIVSSVEGVIVTEVTEERTKAEQAGAGEYYIDRREDGKPTIKFRYLNSK